LVADYIKKDKPNRLPRASKLFGRLKLAIVAKEINFDDLGSLLFSRFFIFLCFNKISKVLAFCNFLFLSLIAIILVLVMDELRYYLFPTFTPWSSQAIVNCLSFLLRYNLLRTGFTPHTPQKLDQKELFIFYFLVTHTTL
jgi:hypothetical protein